MMLRRSARKLAEMAAFGSTPQPIGCGQLLCAAANLGTAFQIALNAAMRWLRLIADLPLRFRLWLYDRIAGPMPEAEPPSRLDPEFTREETYVI
jgi:hypothetical protein